MPENNDSFPLSDSLYWEGLVTVAPLLVSTMDRDLLLRWILRMATRVVGAEACTLALNNLQTGELDYAVVLGDREDAVRQFPVHSGEGILGWVALHGKPVVAADASKHPLWNRAVAEKIGFETRSIVCVPLEVKKQTIGALEVLNKLDGGPFTDADVEILAAFANVAAFAVENARLYQWLEKRADDAEGELLALNRMMARKKAELDTVISTISDGLIILDAAGLVTELNPAAERFLGLHRAEVLGTRAGEGPLADTPLAPVLAHAHASRDEGARREWTVAFPEGRTFNCHLCPFAEDTGVPGLALVMSDVTDLAEISRLKSEFVAYVSHELKAPLAVVRGFVDTLLPPLGDDISAEQRVDFLRIIRGEADRTLRLIASLLDITRIEAGRALDLARAPVDLAALAGRAITTAQSLSARHRLSVEAETDLAPVSADADRIEQVLLNLLSNAVKYSPEGGSVVVRVAQEAEGVRVSVSDPGIGMTPEQQSRLFGRYQRVLADKAIAGGTGLGLYFSKGIVDAHGGRIWVESAPGQGSTFFFTLPAA